MKRQLLLICAFMLGDLTVYAADFAVGADLSNLKQAEDRGFVFKDNGIAKPGLQIFKDHGYNWIRLRLFHTPTMAQDLQYAGSPGSARHGADRKLDHQRNIVA